MAEEGLTDEDMKALAGLTNLTDLRLSHNDISDLTPLAGLKNLTFLMFGDNEINDADIEWLKAQLPCCDIHFTL